MSIPKVIHAFLSGAMTAHAFLSGAMTAHAFLSGAMTASNPARYSGPSQ